MRFKVFLESQEFERTYLHATDDFEVYRVALNRVTKNILRDYYYSWNNNDDGETEASDIVGDEKLHDRICRIFGYDEMFARDQGYLETGRMALILTNTPELDFNILSDQHIKITYEYGEFAAVENIPKSAVKETFYAEPKRAWKYFSDSQDGGPEFNHFTNYGKGFKLDAILRHDEDKYTLELIHNKKTFTFDSAEELITYMERFLSLDKITVDDLAKLETVTESKRGNTK